MNKAIFKINDIPINDLFFNYHGNKKPKFKKNVLDLTLNKQRGNMKDKEKYYPRK